MNILWLKKDLRLKDHLPLHDALQSDCIVVYLFEPSLSYNYDFDIRHWQFIYQSLLDLKDQGLKVQLFYGEALDFFQALNKKYNSLNIFSHQETGNDLTYQRDLELKSYFKNESISWNEYSTNAVIRGLKNRNSWDATWIKYVKRPISENEVHFNNVTNIDLSGFTLPKELESQLQESSKLMIKGGESQAWNYLGDFLENKIGEYFSAISYPEKSRYYCSMLSVFITYGNLTIRQIYQASEKKKSTVRNKVSLNQFMARLKWHCHFIQKLEMQPNIEFKNLNSAFNNIRQKKNKKFIKAWKSGMTGYPLVDAAMRCVEQTGYLNFRLRSMVVSFLTHLLWQPWQSGAGHLARQFLDYEPGIHFSQFQMQAGTTGINTIRIYNPIKQSKEKDKEGIFIRKWVPELREIPNEYIHEPWMLSEIDSLMYGFKIGRDYPEPIVEFETAYKYARDKLWELRKSDKSKKSSREVLKKHVRNSKKR